MMPIGTPRVPYRNREEGTWQWVDIWNALVRSIYYSTLYIKLCDKERKKEKKMQTLVIFGC